MLAKTTRREGGANKKGVVMASWRRCVCCGGELRGAELGQWEGRDPEGKEMNDLTSDKRNADSMFVSGWLMSL